MKLTLSRYRTLFGIVLQIFQTAFTYAGTIVKLVFERKLSLLEISVTDVRKHVLSQRKAISNQTMGPSAITDDLGVRRNEVWTLANEEYHRSNFRESTRLLLSADALEDEAAIGCGFNPLDLRFVGESITCSIGHSAAGLAMRAGLVTLEENAVERYWVLNDSAANPAFLDYWKRYFTIIPVDKFANTHIQHSFWPLLESISSVRTQQGSEEQRVVHNYVATRRQNLAMPPLLDLAEEHRQKGEETLRAWGLGDRRWFVALHVREGDPLYGRNADVASYLPAIQAILDCGGAVVRIGSPGMRRIPKLEGLFDYANCGGQEDWLDVYLMAACRFMVGTTSGPINVAYCFGRPILWTNAPDLGKAVYFPSTVMLPKLVVDRNGDPLNLQQLLDSPAGWSDSYLGWITDDTKGTHLGLEWRDNSTSEIRAAVIDMLHFTKSETGWSGPNHLSDDPVQMALASLGANVATPIAPSFLLEWTSLFSTKRYENTDR